MKTIINAVKTSIQAFVRDEEGAVVIEYVLVAGIVSIAAAANLGTLAAALNASLVLVTAAV